MKLMDTKNVMEFQDYVRYLIKQMKKSFKKEYKDKLDQISLKLAPFLTNEIM